VKSRCEKNKQNKQGHALYIVINGEDGIVYNLEKFAFKAGKIVINSGTEGREII
jgi:hypothetical protein